MRLMLDTNVLIDLESAPAVLADLRAVAWQLELLITPVQVAEDRDGTIRALDLPLLVVPPVDGLPVGDPAAADLVVALAAEREAAVVVTGDRELTLRARADGLTVWSLADLAEHVRELRAG